MDRTKFYSSIRGMFGGSLSQAQVDGIENLLDVWDANYAATGNAEELAYNLGTAFHETGATMQPIRERGAKSYFNKYEPGTRIGKVLGNTRPGDGYRYKGEGHVQNTGRGNAIKATLRLNEVFGLGLDLVANPSQRGDPFVSAHSLFLGNREGWWTGRKLADYIDGIDEEHDEDFREYVRARAVVNGSDKAAKIAGYAIKFEDALKAAGYGVSVPTKHAKPASKTTQKPASAPAPAPKPTAPAKPASGWRAILEVLLAIFGRKI